MARASGAFVIEDDFAWHLGHGGPVPRPLVADDRDGTVVHVTSLTRPAAPSLRIGFAATAGLGELTEGVRRLGAALADLVRQERGQGAERGPEPAGLRLTGPTRPR